MPKMTMCYHCMQEAVVNGRCTICNAPAERFVPAENELVLPPGTLLDDGNIMVGARLGSGGFGITYVARDNEFGVIALKEFVPRYMITGRRGLDLLVNPDKWETYEKTMRSFRRESNLLSVLHHPNIVSVLFEMQENSTAYYGMELLQGEDLGKHIRNAGAPMDAGELCELLIPVIDALAYLHTQKALHRDLSPDNIFLRKDPGNPFKLSPCLIDFGAASSARQDFMQTVPGVKKNGYSPLEQNWDRKLQGPFTDVYAFAATLYYALTMKVPIPAGDRLQKGQDLLKPPSSYNPNVSRAVDDVVMRGLALMAKDRIQNMLQLGLELCAAVNVASPVQWRMGRTQWGGAVGTPPPEPPKPPEPVEPPKPVEPPRPPEPDPAPKPPEPAPVSEPLRPSPANLIALLLDALLLMGLPVLAMALALPESGVLLGVVAGVALMLILNVVLVCIQPRGTLGQRMLGLELYTKGAEPTLHALCYAVLRVLLPLSALDALVGIASKSTTLLERMTDVRVAPRGRSDEQVWSVPLRGGSDAGGGSFVSSDSVSNPSVVTDGSSISSFPHSGPQAVEELSSASLACTRGEYKGKTIRLYDAKGLTIGRDQMFATLPFSERNSYISHKHCELMKRTDGWYVVDHSTYGTFVNGKRIPSEGSGTPIRSGDRLQFGKEIFVFKNERGGRRQ